MLQKKTMTLKESLRKRKVSDLKTLASLCMVKGISKLKKEELVEVCANAILRDGFFSEHALILSPEAWAFYRRVADSKGILCANIAPEEYFISELFGFLCVEKVSKGDWFIVPDEIKEIYRQTISDDFLHAKALADLIHQYAQAAVNLYGAISQEELVRIFNTQNKLQTNIDTNFAVFRRHIGLDADYCLWEDYIVHNDLEENDFEGARNLIWDAGDKPRYIPAKAEFLRYANWAYYENSKQLIDLSRFLLGKCGVANEQINQLMFDFQWNFAQEESTQAHFDLLEENGIILPSNQVDEFVRHIVECANHTRLWVNKGHTPNELARFYRSPVRQKAPKIGRNDPCPCGSGKKYKKCCGR